jgi:hypothetical protein
MKYIQKYFKYKQKYLYLKKQIGGMESSVDNSEILKKYKETMYISKNKHLQQIICEALDVTFNQDAQILEYVSNNKWKDFDEYIIINNGIDNFYKLFQQLFFLHNLAKVITLNQYQIALGIQQVRWMVDPKNEENMKMFGIPPNITDYKDMNFMLYQVTDAQLFIWEEIPTEEKTAIQQQIYDYIKDQLYESHINNTLNDHYNGSIWYKDTTSAQVGAFKGFGLKYEYYPITETINFSNIACMYCPVLVFGILSGQSLLKHIILHKERPYAMHFPRSRRNLVVIHGLQHMILANWRHDFVHLRNELQIHCDTGFEYIKKNCNRLR